MYDAWESSSDDEWNDRMYMNASDLSAKKSPKRSPAKSPTRKSPGKSPTRKSPGKSPTRKSSKKSKQSSSWEAFKAWWTTPVSSPKKSSTKSAKKSGTKSGRKRLGVNDLQPMPIVTPLAMEPVLSESRYSKRNLNPVPLEPLSLSSQAWQDWFRGNTKKRMGAAETRPLSPKFGERTVNSGMKNTKAKKKKSPKKTATHRSFGRKL